MRIETQILYKLNLTQKTIAKCFRFYSLEKLIKISQKNINTVLLAQGESDRIP